MPRARLTADYRIRSYTSQRGYSQRRRMCTVPIYRSYRYLSNYLTGTYLTTEQVLIAWSAANGFCCLPKSVHPDRIKENLAAASLELMPEVRIVAV